MKTPPNLLAEAEKAWRLGTAPFRKKPDFLIPGAPKSGTSSLYDLIAMHPEVCRGHRKEPTNFIHYPTSELRSRMNQPFSFGRFLCGEGSVEYFFHPDAPANAAAIVPNAKVIFLLREPVARAWSEYRMFVRSGHEQEEFALVVSRAIGWLSDSNASALCESACRNSFNPVRYVRCGMYAELLARWWRAFPKEQTLVLFSEDFFADSAKTADRIYRFLGLPECNPEKSFHARDSGDRTPPPPEAVSELRAFYAPHNEQLRNLPGISLPWNDH